MNKQRINEIVDYMYNLYTEIQELHEIVRLGNEEIISRSDAVKLMDYSAKYRQIFTIEFIKRTDNTKRVMNGMTGVRRYVNGRGMPYDNIAKGLMTMYDTKAPGSGPDKYRQVPVDNILRLKIKGRVFKVVDDAQYATMNKPFASKANKDSDVPVLPADATKAQFTQNQADRDASAPDPRLSNKLLTPTNKIGKDVKANSKADSGESGDNQGNAQSVTPKSRLANPTNKEKENPASDSTGSDRSTGDGEPDEDERPNR